MPVTVSPLYLIKANQGVGGFSSQAALSPQTICFLLFVSFMGWLWVRDRRSTGAVGNSGIISPLNCNPMSARMALNIPKQFITFMSVFILFPLWAWLSRSPCSAQAVQCCRQCTGPLITAGVFIRQKVTWQTQAAFGPIVTLNIECLWCHHNWPTAISDSYGILCIPAVLFQNTKEALLCALIWKHGHHIVLQKVTSKI